VLATWNVQYRVFQRKRGKGNAIN